jgi:hypothetical protein
MFVPLIAGLIAYLVIISYISTSMIENSSENIKLTYTKIAYTFPKEEVIRVATEAFCKINTDKCKNDQQVSITNDLKSGYLTSEFQLNNDIGGQINDIVKITTTEIQIKQTIPDQTKRYLYLNHYNGRKYGIPPKCTSTDETHTEITKPPCTSTEVYHKYPVSEELKGVL